MAQRLINGSGSFLERALSSLRSSTAIDRLHPSRKAEVGDRGSCSQASNSPSSSAYFVRWPGCTTTRMGTSGRAIFAIVLQDGSMLLLVQIEREHDAVGRVDQIAARASEQRAGSRVLGPVAHDHVVTRAFKEGPVELASEAGRDVDENQAVGIVHRPACRRCAGALKPIRAGAPRLDIAGGL